MGGVAFGIVTVGSATASLVATAASVAISAFVVGMLHFLVLANVLEQTTEEIETTGRSSPWPATPVQWDTVVGNL